jgi:hypothetical protein
MRLQKVHSEIGEDSPENDCDRIRTAGRVLDFLTRRDQRRCGGGVIGDGNGGYVRTGRCLSGVVPVEDGLVWFEDGEYERSKRSDEELWNDDKNVVYALRERACDYQFLFSRGEGEEE